MASRVRRELQTDENAAQERVLKGGRSTRTAFKDLSNVGARLGQVAKAEKKDVPVEVVNWVDTLAACDRPDVTNIQTVAEYASDIFNVIREREGHYVPSPDYFDRSEVTPKMRSILVDWLIEVHQKFKLTNETLYLTINIIDRYLSLDKVGRKTLQLLGVAAMLIASKYEEIYAPEVRDFIYICDKAYTRDEILNMEVTILNKLKFNVTVPSSLTFLRRYAKLSNVQAGTEHMLLCQYFLELALVDSRFLKFSVSMIASAALLLANKVVKRSPSWPTEVAEMTEHTEAQVKACAKELCNVLQGVEQSSLQAVKKKFSSQKFLCVAKMIV